MDREPIVQKAKKTKLEDIVQRKYEVLEEIRIQKDIITQSGSRVFAPFNPSDSGNTGIMKRVNTGIAIFDGVLIGYKIIKNIRRFFRR